MFCYLCLGLGPSRETQCIREANSHSPPEKRYYAIPRAEPWSSAKPWLGAFIGLAHPVNSGAPIFAGETSGPSGASPYHATAFYSALD
jgi:hypothetical protein